jgi:uncharacterized protein YndB with AHSA1/START domain
MPDVAQQINAVSRAVGRREFGPGEARVSTISQAYAADADDVWDACTDPERLRRWFLPVTGELKVGGRYQLQGNAGGTIERCDPPKSFSATWEFGGQVSWIEVRVVPEAEGKTRFELEHIAHVADDLWDTYGPGATGVGWDLAFFGLAQYLGPDPALTPENAEAWAASPEGVEFVTQAAHRWYEADVAAGTAEHKARAAADRVREFYTTPPPPPAEEN